MKKATNKQEPTKTSGAGGGGGYTSKPKPIKDTTRKNRFVTGAIIFVILAFLVLAFAL